MNLRQFDTALKNHGYKWATVRCHSDICS